MQEWFRLYLVTVWNKPVGAMLLILCTSINVAFNRNMLMVEL